MKMRGGATEEGGRAKHVLVLSIVLLFSLLMLCFFALYCVPRGGGDFKPAPVRIQAISRDGSPDGPTLMVQVVEARYADSKRGYAAVELVLSRETDTLFDTFVSEHIGTQMLVRFDAEHVVTLPVESAMRDHFIVDSEDWRGDDVRQIIDLFQG